MTQFFLCLAAFLVVAGAGVVASLRHWSRTGVGKVDGGLFDFVWSVIASVLAGLMAAVVAGVLGYWLL